MLMVLAFQHLQSFVNIAYLLETKHQLFANGGSHLEQGQEVIHIVGGPAEGVLGELEQLSFEK